MSFQVLQLFANVSIMHTNIYIDLCRDIVLVELMLLIVLGGEIYSGDEWSGD
jgi:hypothetical protein